MATNILFAYDNSWFDAATLTESSQVSTLPAENLQHPFRSKVWRTSGGGTENLVINFGAAKAVTFIAIIGYTWTSAPSTLNLEFNSSDSWVTPAATEALTWAANPTTNGNQAIICKKFTEHNYQYARLNVVYGANFDIGRIFLGAHFEPNDNYLLGHEEDIIDPSVVEETLGGQAHIDELTIYRAYRLSSFIETQAQWELYQKMFRSAGRHTDIVICFDYDNEPNEETIYGKFTALPAMVRPFHFNIDMEFMESR